MVPPYVAKADTEDPAWARNALISRKLITDRGYANPQTDFENWSSVLSVAWYMNPPGSNKWTYRHIKLKDVSDGTSNTMMLFEDAGRPDKWVAGTLTSETGTVTGSGWSNDLSWYNIHNECGGLVMNCHNDNEIYSFHNSGCNFAFGDGSVHFIDQGIDPEAFVSLFTRSAGDVIPSGAL
jgi:prepilin-type processing-associated H-X9-DG protein